MKRKSFVIGFSFLLAFLLIACSNVSESDSLTKIDSQSMTLIAGADVLIPTMPTLTQVPRATLIPTATSIPTAVGPALGSQMISSKDGMTMIYVPAGESLMGSDGKPEEKPVHSVYLDAYWIDQTEVTNAMYAKCVDAGVCESPKSGASATRGGYYPNPNYANYPVIFVSWNDANNYCLWAERRLPMEAEWEKAASWDDNSQQQRVFPWGDSYYRVGEQANQVLFDDGYNDTSPVGNYEEGQSFYNAYDMMGNVWEWTADWFQSNYYSNSPTVNPLGPESGTERVLRGGSWSSYTYSAKREIAVPSKTDKDIGFRCAMDADQP